MIIRDFTRNLEQRLQTHVPFIQVVLGPRQVGKTTAIKQIIDSWAGESIYETADLPSPPDVEWITTHWERAKRKISQPTLLVLDEVQKIERWSEVVKIHFDRDRHERNLRIVLLGSASLALGRGLSESLAGRFEINHCYHWSFDECHTAFGWCLEQYLQFGGYPAPVQLISDVKRWMSFMHLSIIEPVISLDILTSANIGNPGLFRQTLELALSNPARELSYQKFLGQLHDKGNTSTVKGYLDILEQAFILKQLRKYRPNSLSTRVSSPKIIPLCPALINTFSLPTKVLDNTSWRGMVFESFIGAELLRRFRDVYYWRDGRNEVDFIVETGGQLFGIEVKLERARNKKGMSSFLKKYPKAIPLIITEMNLDDLP